MPVLIIALVLVASIANADEAADKALALNKEGTQLAEKGQHAAAIERFKSAELLLPRYQHHCNIGIAYQDSNRFPQALLFLQSCIARAGKNATPAAKARLAAVEAKVKGAPFAALVVTGEQLLVSVEPWSDEAWVVDGQRRFVLEGRDVTLSVRRRDGTTWTQSAALTPGSDSMLVLAPPPPPPVIVAEVKPVIPPPVESKPIPTPAPPAVVTPVAAPRSVVPWVVMGVGAGVAALGLVPYFLASGQRGSFAADAPESALTGYRALIVASYTSFGLGLAAAATGLIWGLLSNGSPSVALIPTANGFQFGVAGHL